MKTIQIKALSLAVSSFLLIQADAFASDRHGSKNVQYSYATVLSVEPISKEFYVSKPEQQCYQRQVSVATGRPNSTTNRLLGTFIGAAIGNAVGHKKSNKRIGAFAGALLGGAIADDISRESYRNNRQYSQQWVTQCDTVSVEYRQTRIIGYRVSYLFNGETYTTRLKRDPGNSLRIRTSITPVID